MLAWLYRPASQYAFDIIYCAESVQIMVCTSFCVQYLKNTVERMQLLV